MKKCDFCGEMQPDNARLCLVYDVTEKKNLKTYCLPCAKRLAGLIVAHMLSQGLTATRK